MKAQSASLAYADRPEADERSADRASTNAAGAFLPPKLKAVLAYVVGKYSLGKTQLSKLPYIIDVLAVRHLGRPITDGHHQAWTHGVVTSEAWRYLHRSADPESLFAQSAGVFRARRSGGPEESLDIDEREIIDFAATEFGSMNATRLGKLTKLMNPRIKKWGDNKPANTDQDAYDRSTPEYQEMVKVISRIKSFSETSAHA